MAKSTYRDGLKNKTKLIAHAILKSEGIGALQARRVAMDSGCSVGTLYNIFESLDALIIAANAITVAELGDALAASRAAQPAEAALETRLLALAAAYLTFAVDNQHGWRALFEHRLPPDRNVPDWYREAQAPLFDIVASDVAPYVPDPEQRARAARALFGAVHGIVSLALDEKLGAFDRRACEAEVHLIVTAAARGLTQGFAANRLADGTGSGSGISPATMPAPPSTAEPGT